VLKPKIEGITEIRIKCRPDFSNAFDKGLYEAYKDTIEISFNNNRKILQGGEMIMCYITCCPNTLGNFWQIF
jgi:hypothetical protein